jgi:hypothetical protein
MGNLSRIEWEAANLRHHVALGDFGRAQASARLYAGLVAAEMRQVPRARAQQCLRTACELLEWARRNLCAARARLGGQLRQCAGALRYQPANPPRVTHTWKIHA